MSGPLSNLIIDIRPGERLMLNELVTIELIQKSGRVARLRVVAPREVQVKKECKAHAETALNVVASMAD